MAIPIRYGLNDIKDHLNRCTEYLPNQPRTFRALWEHLGESYAPHYNPPPIPERPIAHYLPPANQVLTSLRYLPEDNLSKWYSGPWLDMLEHCMRCIAHRSENQAWLQLHYRHIEELLRSRPSSATQLGHLFSDDIEGLAYRDCIIQSAGLYRLGSNILTADSDRGYQLLWQKLAGSGHFEADYARKMLSRDLDTLSELERKQIINTAWSIATHCHDLGNVSVGPLPDHSPIAVARIDSHLDEQRWPNPYMRVAIRWAQSAIRMHVGLLEKIDSPPEELKYQGGLDLPETWNKYPLGAFLAVVILLHEVAVRICWYPTYSDRSPSDIPDAVLLVNDLTIALGQSITLQFHGKRADMTRILGIPTGMPPMNRHAQERLGKALGRHCLSLVADDVMQVRAVWVADDGKEIAFQPEVPSPLARERSVTHKQTANDGQRRYQETTDSLRRQYEEEKTKYEARWQKAEDETNRNKNLPEEHRQHKLIEQMETYRKLRKKLDDDYNEIKDDLETHGDSLTLDDYGHFQQRIGLLGKGERPISIDDNS